MRTEAMLKLVLAASIVSAVLSGAALYYAMEAAESADDAYGAAESAASYASDAADAAERAARF